MCHGEVCAVKRKQINKLKRVHKNNGNVSEPSFGCTISKGLMLLGFNALILGRKKILSLVCPLASLKSREKPKLIFTHSLLACDLGV